MKLLSENPEFEEMQQICDVRRHFNITMTSRTGHYAAVRVCVCVFFPTGWYGKCSIELQQKYLSGVQGKYHIYAKTLLKKADHRINKGTARMPLK